MNIGVDIEIEDILWEASSTEKRKLFVALLEEFSSKKDENALEYIKSILINPDLIENAFNKISTPGERELNDYLIKISNSYLVLSKEDEEIIQKIAKKY